MKKITALLLCLCLLLCGCSDNEVASAPVSETTTETADISVESTADSTAQSIDESVVEVPSVHEDGGPTDPEELAKWVWAMAEETSDAAFAYDFDLSTLMEVELEGETVYSQISSREKEITTDSGTIFYSSAVSDGQTTREWYADGMYYMTSPLGSFKVPMTVEEYQAQDDTTSSSSVVELYPENFGKLFALRNDNGYGVNFSEPTLDTWMAFSNLLVPEDQEIATCEAFDLEGYMQVDHEGNVTQLKLEMDVVMNIADVPMSMSVTVNQLTMGYNEDVVIDVPVEDESYLELPDLSIPMAITTSRAITEAMPAVAYQKLFAMTLEEEAGVQVVLQTDSIAYSTDENGLTVIWDTIENINGEDVYVCHETFSNGEGLLVENSDETTYYLSDSDMLEYIFAETFPYEDTFAHGSNFQTEHDSDALTYDLDPEYVEETVLEYLTMYGVESLMTEGTVNSVSGNACIWVDASGLIYSQLTSLSVEVEIDGVPVSISIQIACDMVSLGEPVVLE